ncbi:MAG TPA: Stk1 family PASTA domain-containing Ser/Thr kinase [Candidatus Acidoferrales bacterium]|nr:Stk1 family PASTA domain-containing Ser/Thr kinase [Candidatus Acidoferrales bacterium]
MIEQQTFNNRYRLDRKLGEGGMATVYGGTDTVLRRRVAIKVLRPQYAADEEFVRRFYQEAESAARLSHPNIVNTYDVGREGDTYFIVMELVDGSSLAEIIADGALPEPVAIDYAAQICNGLAYAHRSGLLHRDIKPANILVTKDDVVKLSDFGIARAVSQQTMALTKPGLVMGSVYYISPEQAQGHELHESSDLYSAGIVLYQMLTGKLPYTGESPVTVALKHIGDPVPIIDPGDSGISPAVAAIVNKLLQKRPENRFHSASEVATALREARERPAVAAYQIADDAPTQMMHSVLPPRRSPMPDQFAASALTEEPRRSSFGLVATLLLLALVATGVGILVFGRPFTLAGAGASITVGDYTNMTDTQAEAEVVNAGLVARFIKSPSDTVPANHVIHQNPDPGTKVDRNSLVELIVSNGLPLVGLPDVRGYNVSDAERTLEDDGFKVKRTLRFDSAPKDSVIDQTPKARAQVRKGATISLIVSQGPQSLAAPNFVNMSVSDAQAIAQKLGITLDTSQQVADPNVPSGVIDAQDILPGQTIARGQTVHATVSTGAAPSTTAIVVPSLVGMRYKDAVQQLQTLGFQPAITFSTQADHNGTIVAQDPAPGTQANSGRRVTLTLSVNGEVPDTEGESPAQAQDTLASYGYQVGKIEYTTSEGADGNVIRTDPEAGTNLSPGSPVTLVVNGTGK